ncbi:unnamed protein product [Boreogadus saida]
MAGQQSPPPPAWPPAPLNQANGHQTADCKGRVSLWVFIFSLGEAVSPAADGTDTHPPCSGRGTPDYTINPCVLDTRLHHQIPVFQTPDYTIRSLCFSEAAHLAGC